jgi:hypothetical protein
VLGKGLKQLIGAQGYYWSGEVVKKSSGAMPLFATSWRRQPSFGKRALFRDPTLGERWTLSPAFHSATMVVHVWFQQDGWLLKGAVFPICQHC